MDQLDQWKQYATSVNYRAGDFVFHEGDRAEEAFILSQGRVAIVKASGNDTSLVLGERSVGHLIGEMGLLQDAPRSASAIAQSRAFARPIRAAVRSGGSARRAGNRTPGPAPISMRCAAATWRFRRSRWTSPATRRWRKSPAGLARSANR